MRRERANVAFVEDKIRVKIRGNGVRGSACECYNGSTVRCGQRKWPGATGLSQDDRQTVLTRNARYILPTTA